MLSILIPTYNGDVQPLVHDLLHQARQLNIAFEILIEDDASPNRSVCVENHSLLMEPEVIYYQNHVNKGRSKVRNHLAAAAHYPYLLFIDGDAAMKNSDYISQYVQYVRFHQNADQPFVVSGGVAYRDMIPDPAFRLRWKYGVAREQRTAAVRNMNPYRSFTPFNLLLSKSVFDKVSFDEWFTTYGFEDVLFGDELRQKKIPVTHIDNEMYHDGIDANEDFLHKTENAVANLAAMYKASKVPEGFASESKLMKTFLWCKRLHVAGIVGLGLRIVKKPLQWLAVRASSVFALDLLKLEGLIAALRK